MAQNAGRRKMSKSCTTITNSQLAQAALEFMDRRGIGALSFRKLSEETDVPTMTIANRFGSRDALLKAALGIMLAENPIRPVENETWQHALKRVACANRQMALRHPRTFSLFVTIPPFESPVLEFTQSVFSTHQGMGLPPEMPEVFLSLMHPFLSGFQFAEMYATEALRRTADTDGETLSPEASQMAQMFTEDTFKRNVDIIIKGIEESFNLPKENE